MGPGLRASNLHPVILKQMPLPLLIASLALSIMISLAVNGIWLWIAVRIVGTAKASLPRAILVALAIVAAILLAGLLSRAVHPTLILLALPAALALSAWLIRRTFALSRWRAVGALAGMFVMMALTNAAIGLAIRALWLAAFIVSSASMEPTLNVGDRFIVDRTLTPQRWDCVVFHPASSPAQVLVKRVVGLPGEIVALRGNTILINGNEVPLPSVYSGRRFDTMDHDPRTAHRGTADGPFTLGPDEFFVVGDNIERSLDSRNWSESYGPGIHSGAVPRSALVGVARAIYSPATHARLFR